MFSDIWRIMQVFILSIDLGDCELCSKGKDGENAVKINIGVVDRGQIMDVKKFC